MVEIMRIEALFSNLALYLQKLKRERLIDATYPVKRQEPICYGLI